MQTFGKIFLLSLLWGCSTHSFDTEGPITENRFIPEEDFLRISEYFTGREPETDRIYVRTDPEARGGYYWIFPITAEMEEADIARVDLWVQIPGNPQVRRFRLTPERIPRQGQSLWVGLTGVDWPGIKFGPVAWKISILSAAGEPVETRTSYLWTENPLKSERGTESPDERGGDS